MLVRFDESLQRLVSLFLAPILNVIFLSFLLTYPLSGVNLASVVSGLDLSGLSKYFLDAAAALLGGEDFIKFLKEQSAMIGRVSGVVSLIFFALLIVAIIILDRIIYLLGWAVPLDFKFSYSAYGSSHRDSLRVKHLYGILDEKAERGIGFEDAYGVVTSHLGLTNADPSRTAQRGALVSQLRVARDAFVYIKGFVLIAVILLFVPGFSISRLLLLLFAMGAAMAICAARFSHIFEDVLTFDIETFLWTTWYDKDRKISDPKTADTSSLRLVAHQGWANRILAPLYLKYEPSSFIFAWKLIRRKPS